MSVTQKPDDFDIVAFAREVFTNDRVINIGGQQAKVIAMSVDIDINDVLTLQVKIRPLPQIFGNSQITGAQVVE